MRRSLASASMCVDYGDLRAVGRRGAALGRGAGFELGVDSSMLALYTAQRDREARLAIQTAPIPHPGSQTEFERAQRVAGGDVDPADLEWLSKGFSAFLAGAGAVALERCLRLPRNDSALRRASRNFWLCRAWESLGTPLSPWRRSEKLATAVRDFKSRQWPRWRTLDQPPPKASELDTALFHAFRSHGRVPSTAMQLHNIATQNRES